MARIGVKALSQLCYRVGMSLKAGVDARTIWEKEAHRGSAAQRKHSELVSRHIASGESMAKGFESCDGYFPPLACELVNVGEKTGTLEAAFLHLNEHYKNILTLRGIFLMGIAWPMFELVLAILVIAVLILVLGMVSGGKIAILGLSGASGAMTFLGMVGGAASILGFFIFSVSRGWINSNPLIRVLLFVPYVGHSMKTMALSRLAWTLSMAHHSGVDAPQTVGMAIRSTQNPYYLDTLDEVQRVVASGGEMHEAFSYTHAYPTDFLDALETGEQAGAISETMETLAKSYAEQAKWSYKILAGAAAVILFLLVGGMMIGMIIYLFRTLYMAPINEALEF